MSFAKLRQFAPSTLNDENDFITVCTEIGDFELPLLSRREQPSLKVADPVDCGCMLAAPTDDHKTPILSVAPVGLGIRQV